MKEHLIIEKAQANLEKQTQLRAHWQPHDGQKDGEISFTYNDEIHRIPIEIKKEVRAHQLAGLIDLKRSLNKLMVVAEYIYPKLKEQLRAEGIAYLETNGNIFIRDGNLFLWVDNAKPDRTETTIRGRAFGKTGLKLLFQLLLEEDLLNLTYREIAERTGVSFGNINFILSDLKEQGYLIPLKKDTFRFSNKKQLLQKWLSAYNDKLKPALRIGTFRFMREADYVNWKMISLTPGETFWGGEPAGGLLTNYLQPEQYTLYTIENLGDLLKKYRLAPDENGEVSVYQKFWKGIEEAGPEVPALLVYTDLINSSDRRCIQAAEKIYDAYLQGKF